MDFSMVFIITYRFVFMILRLRGIRAWAINICDYKHAGYIYV